MKTSARRRDGPAGPKAAWSDMRDRLSRLNAEAAEATLPAKAEHTLRQWFSRQSLDPGHPGDLKAAAFAMTLALELESFTPSPSGSTGVERIARWRKLDPEDAAAHRALGAARFTVFLIGRSLGGGRFSAEDLAGGHDLALFAGDLPAEAVAFPLAARIAALDGSTSTTVGMVVPLDDAGLAVALEFVRPGRGIPHGHRCAAAVYKHVVRHGGPNVQGLNAFSDMIDDALEEESEPSPIDVLVAALVASDRWRDPPKSVIDEVRNLASGDAVLVCLFHAVSTPKTVSAEPGAVYRRFAAVMIEALQLRAQAGSGLERAPLDRVGEAIAREMKANGYPRAAADLFRDIRAALSAARPRQAGDDLARVIERIRALRAKTVDQGCTEQEALAAADKVAELLDRYGLSLGETDLREQACLGVGIDSTRKRMGPLDDCVPAIAHFCDCRAWNERTPAGTIRSMFFGLPADVEGAQYLFERVATALETETADFRRGELYAGLAGGGRQKATTSFQLGLARGICAKLDACKAERDTKTFQLTGRDLVPVKADVVAEELAKLGMSFTTKNSGRGRTVLLGAYEAGQVASGRFEIRSELE